ncbi:putative ABC transporter ATP-binding protein [Lactococcus lactis]|nr:putative ABC transporter ATP-binding protein [Lactococcus lactis]
MATLEIKNLHVAIEDKEILKGVNLVINTNEIHAIMGPNGTGKSTLSAAIMGNPNYSVTQGEVLFDGQNVLEMSVDERARLGLFLAMQYPSEIPGITNAEFLRAAMNAKRAEDDKVSVMEFIKKLDKNMEVLSMKEEMAERYLNEGFSGGEKKRNEILQLLMLEPTFAILDEMTSDLINCASNICAKVFNSMRV